MTEPGSDWMPMRRNKSTTHPFVHRLHKGLHDELAEMHKRAEHDPDPKVRAAERRRFHVLTGAISAIAEGKINRAIDRGNEKGGHALGFLSDSSDLSDCETTYVWDHDDEKPPYRIVWRQREAITPGKPPLREFIAAGDRQDERVYDTAGIRLHRPKNLSMAQIVERRRQDALQAQREAEDIARAHEAASENHRGILPQQAPARSLFDDPNAVTQAMTNGNEPKTDRPKLDPKPGNHNRPNYRPSIDIDTPEDQSEDQYGT